MTRDESTDLAYRFIAHYEQAAERTPQGYGPTGEEVSKRRAAILRAADAAGVLRLVLLLRDGNLSGRAT